MANDNKKTDNEEATKDNTQLVITLNDFNNVKNIIELASKSGIFHPTEMQEVGSLYNKIVTLIQYMQAAQTQKTDTNKEE